MRLALFFILFYSSASFAEVFQKARVHDCQNDKGFKRRIELQYKVAGAPVPCRVVWFRGDIEEYGVEHVMMNAKHQAGKCEASEQAYLAKMRNWGVNCVLQNSEMSEAPKTQAEAATQAPVTPVPQEEKLPEPPNWNGAYAGVILGTQFGKTSDKSGSFGYNSDNEKWDYNESGLNAAADFGFGFKNGDFVLGPEVELGYLSIKGDGAQPSSPGADTTGQINSDFYAALRFKMGMDFDRNLWFGTVGAIGVNTEVEVVDTCGIAPCGGSTLDAKKDGLDWGYTLGAGVEHMFSNTWTVKLEYLYFNLGEQKFSGVTNLGNSYDWTSETSGHIFRGGINWRF